MRPLLVSFLLLSSALPLVAQENSVLFAGLIKTKGYVVGSALSASGLHHFERDTTWAHVGWNHPKVWAVAQDPANPNILFLACGNGALRSMDGGTSWRITTGWAPTEALDIFIDPNQPEEVYLATAFGIWRTTDRGDTWQEANAGLRETYTQTIAVDYTESGRVLAGTDGGLYISTDGARSWAPVGPTGVPILDLEQSPTHSERWLAATRDHGMLYSTDHGNTWQHVVEQGTFHAIAIDPANDQHMAAVGWDTGVFITHDGGATWTSRQQGLPTPHFYEAVFDVSTPGRLWVATVEEGVFYSDDKGTTWTYAGMYGTLVFDLTFLKPPTP